MGIPFKNIVVKREIDFPELKDKKLAFDGNNVLYQFLSAIRGPDGRPLTNSEGKITSHLMGLFSRTIKLMEHGIISSKDLAAELFNILKSKRDEFIFKMKLTSKDELEVLSKRVENLEVKLKKFELKRRRKTKSARKS